MIGVSNGRKKHPLNNSKLLEGSIAGTVAGFLTAWIFVAWWQALIAAVVAMTIEALEIKIYEWDLDDNLTIPVVAAAVIFVLQLI
jgi:dolichol kinase